MLHDAPNALVLIDPLVQDDLWPSLDAEVKATGTAVIVLTTITFHARSRDEVARRYGAKLGGELLLDLPVELVLPCHGEPVLDHGLDALARALEP